MASPKKEIGRPLKYKTVQEIEEKIREYFERCEVKEKPFTMSGLALWLDMSRQTLVNYSNREPFFDTIKKARDIVEASMEERMLEGTINTTGAIFALKNNFKWTDKQEIKQETDTKIELVWNDED